jgi:hypothetical protein
MQLVDGLEVKRNHGTEVAALDNEVHEGRRRSWGKSGRKEQKCDDAAAAGAGSAVGGGGGGGRGGAGEGVEITGGTTGLVEPVAPAKRGWAGCGIDEA